jgi:hypothetical protein
MTQSGLYIDRRRKALHRAFHRRKCLKAQKERYSNVKRKPNRTRKIQCIVRLSAQEDKALAHKSDAAGLSKMAYIRKLIMGVNPVRRLPDGWNDVYKELHKIGNNINQIAKVANTTGVIGMDYSHIQAEFWQILSEIKIRVFTDIRIEEEKVGTSEDGCNEDMGASRRRTAAPANLALRGEQGEDQAQRV